MQLVVAEVPTVKTELVGEVLVPKEKLAFQVRLEIKAYYSNIFMINSIAFDYLLSFTIIISGDCLIRGYD